MNGTYSLQPLKATCRIINKGCTPRQFSQVALVVNPPANNAGDTGEWDRSLHWEDPLEEGMATHSSIVAYSCA